MRSGCQNPANDNHHRSQDDSELSSQIITGQSDRHLAKDFSYEKRIRYTSTDGRSVLFRILFLSKTLDIVMILLKYPSETRATPAAS
jgi:hypothetical protein